MCRSFSIYIYNFLYKKYAVKIQEFNNYGLGKAKWCHLAGIQNEKAY